MFRKLTLGLLTAASLAVPALAPSAASAHPFFHPGFHHFYGGPRFFGPRVFVGGPVVYGGGYSCVVRRWVPTPWGPRLRLVNRCY